MSKTTLLGASKAENLTKQKWKQYCGTPCIWTRCTNQNKDFLSLGDLNLCAKTWDEPGYRHASLANKVKDFMLAEDCTHLVTDYTRIRQVLQTTERSCLDQVITNCVSKMTSPEIHSVGKSDHMGVFITRRSREIRTGPRTTRKRIYKEFSKDEFTKDIREAKRKGDFKEIFETNDIDTAIEYFSEAFSAILDKHAPLKTIQNRSNYVPYLTKEIKSLMTSRDALKAKAVITGKTEDYDNY